MNKYQPAKIEKKWQEKWVEEKIYQTDLSSAKDKYYTLVELAYSSGDLHMGHWFTYSYGDILARFKKLQGYNVIFPNGFDAFGLPAENAAIKRSIHPSDWTYSNIDRMKEQFSKLGTMIDWRYTLNACDPEYYKWNQWIFLKLLEKGLAYKGKVLSNWCPVDQTVLANENVENGKCWRCGSEVEQKEIEQWFFKITDYADKLIWPEVPAADWPKALREAQNKWIGKSIGAVVKFGELEVFTTRLDTIFGATFIVISPEHPLVNSLIKEHQKEAVKSYLAEAKRKSELERKENKDKSGVFTGTLLKNPFTNEDIPVWVADYVLMGYGTGAVMAVPAHDARDYEFAEKHHLKIQPVIAGDKVPYSEEGSLINSGEYSGKTSSEARELMLKYIVRQGFGYEKTNYHLHDWSISRQRYWGTPVPIIYCDSCGMLPVPEKDLPVELPYKVDYQPKGKPPLATAEEWLYTKCPQCGAKARREAETMDTFIDSSWYFFRYLDPKNDQEIFNQTLIKNWMPANIYIGGSEHTLGHALYSRFITKFLKDLGLIDFDEYALKRIHHGTILGPDNQKMSKSKGNVINPDEQVAEFGADAVRVYLSFLGPFDIVTGWKSEGIQGIYHYLQRVWGLQVKLDKNNEPTKPQLIMLNKTIKKVTEDLEQMKNNTAIASLMEWLNYLSRQEKISNLEFKNYLQLLSPIAPHITEELWQVIGESFSVHQQPWPKVDEGYLVEESIVLVIQVNGKVRDQFKVSRSITEKEIVELALKSERINKYIAGQAIKKTIYIPGKILNIVI